MTTPLDLSQVDRRAFARDLDALRAEIDASLSTADVKHLLGFERVARLCAIAGYSTAWLAVNPISAFLISCGTFVRWAVMMHHVGHRGYDKVPGAPNRLKSKRFGRGWRRWIDWLDWMPTDAWLHEHNTMHHGVRMKRPTRISSPATPRSSAGCVVRKCCAI